MAGSVRRKSSPVVAPSAKANKAYPAGTNPCRPKAAAPKRSWFTLSMGLNHHVTIRLKSPPTAALARPTSPSLTSNQRIRLTLCVQARRKVPVSSSRAMSGAPQNMPMRTGTMSTRAVAKTCSFE